MNIKDMSLKDMLEKSMLFDEDKEYVRLNEEYMELYRKSEEIRDKLRQCRKLYREHFAEYDEEQEGCYMAEWRKIDKEMDLCGEKLDRRIMELWERL